MLCLTPLIKVLFAWAVLKNMYENINTYFIKQ